MRRGFFFSALMFLGIFSFAQLDTPPFPGAPLTAGDGGRYYVPGDDEGPHGLEVGNYLDFGRFFETLEGQNEPGNLVANYRGINGRLPGGEGQGFEWLMSAYVDRGAENAPRREALRSLVCRHPLEWNKDLYDDAFFRRARLRFRLDGEREGHLRAKMAKQDLWSNAEGRLEGDALDALRGRLPDGNAWFAHPVYFINHLDKAGLLEPPDRSFNPYYGNHKTAYADRRMFNSADNPGFATKVRNIGNNLSNTANGILYNEEYYGRITGLFNEDFTLS